LNIAIILAGGIGSRVGSDTPKQFIEVMGKPVIVYTIEKFQSHDEIDFIQVVCVKDHIDHMKELIEKYRLTKVKWIVEGGSTFLESAVNGVNHLQGICDDDDIVSLHFAASPFVEHSVISDSLLECRKQGNAVSTTPFYLLSGVKTGESASTKYLDRETIACMNSPHTFRYGLIKRLFDEGRRAGLIDDIDPFITALMYALEEPIYFSSGSQTNIKITTKEDLELFEGYVMYKNKEAAN
jgi:2-C-methyl-D-erythritol 4-phosphate cytidylyltransferase